MNYYIHVPFCRSKCGYCAFYSEVCSSGQRFEQYLEKLTSDMASAPLLRAHTIYIGGGTPTILTSEQLKEISISNNFACVQGGDYGYGLGVRIRQKPTEWGLNKGEFGWDGAAGSYVMMDPNKKVSIFIGLHLRNWPVSFMGKHLPIVEKIYTELKEIIN